MDVRKKLVELLVEFVEIDVWDNGEFIDKDIDFDKIAENLIAHGVTVQECKLGIKKTNANRIRSMSDKELAEYLTHIDPTNCQNCVFSHGWRCQPDRNDYSDFEKCIEGRRRWLQQPAEVSK